MQTNTKLCLTFLASSDCEKHWKYHMNCMLIPLRSLLEMRHLTELEKPSYLCTGWCNDGIIHTVFVECVRQFFGLLHTISCDFLKGSSVLMRENLWRDSSHCLIQTIPVFRIKLFPFPYKIQFTKFLQSEKEEREATSWSKTQRDWQNTNWTCQRVVRIPSQSPSHPRATSARCSLQSWSQFSAWIPEVFPAARWCLLRQRLDPKRRFLCCILQGKLCFWKEA